jgi:flagellar basal-body rod modification protein FlgD
MNELNALTDFDALGLGRRDTSSNANEIGQEQFLTLMLAQFRNQDPFEPMENGEFLSQLAEFSTVSGIQGLQSSFTGLSESIYSDQALQASSLVGRDVLVETSFASLADDGGVRGALDIEGASGRVAVDVTDASGQLIRTIDLGVQPAGSREFSWDGLDADGDPAAAGLYRFTARVTRGQQVEGAPIMIRAAVDSVTLGRAGEGLTLNSDRLGEIPLNQVRRIL